LGKLNLRSCIIFLVLAYSVGVISTFAGVYQRNYGATKGNELPNRREVGGDFVAFYVAGKLALEDPSHLYDFARQSAEEKEQFIGTEVALGALPFVYPPLIALLFSCFSGLTLLNAYLCWAGISIAFFICAVLVALSNPKRELREIGALTIIAFAFVPFILDCLGSGQTSCLGLLIFAGIATAQEKRAYFLAGLILGLGYYKPPLFVFFSLTTIVAGNWRMICGALTSGIALLIGTVLWFGRQNFFTYISAARHYSYGQELASGTHLPTSRGLGLYAILNEHLGAGTPTANLLFAVILLLALSLPRILARTRFEQNERLALAAQISLSLFFSLQMVVYDLTILIVPFILFYQSAQKWNLSGIRAIATVALVGLYLEWLTRGPELDFTCARLSFALWCGSILALALTEREERPIPS